MPAPEKIIMVGPCRASIFKNLIRKDGQEILMPKVVFEVRFKDKQGRWCGTSALSLHELPKPTSTAPYQWPEQGVASHTITFAP